jgi:hypothetical protein
LSEQRINELVEVVRSAGTDVVARVWPVLDDHQLAKALSHDDLETRMLAVSELVEQVIPMPDSPNAVAAVRTSIRLGVLSKLVSS